MKTERISFGKISAEIKLLGAELCSLKYNGHELLWQGDKTYWTGQAPVLFPIVGALRDNKAYINGNEYKIPKHGIAINSVFQVKEISEDKIVLVLNSNEESRKIYPFDFALSVEYKLDDDGLSVKFTVENNGNEEIPYFIGGHPAFNVPMLSGLSFEDYAIRFEKDENISCPKVNLSSSLIDFSEEEYHLNGNEIKLSHTLFSRDALIFDGLKSQSIKLESNDGEHGIKVIYNDFPMLAFWSAQNSAPFVAIEPWCGSGTRTSEDDIFEHKKYVQKLKKGDRNSYSMSFYPFGFDS